MLEHNANISDARRELFAEFAGDHFMTFGGEVSRELFDLVEAMHSKGT
jgi:hypothetical protein